MSAGPQGRELAELTQRHGAGAIRAEVAHPGVGSRLVMHLGDDGVELAGRLTKDQAMDWARHADDLARLSPAQREGVLNLVRKDPDAMTSFIGRFLEKNPGKTLFTVGAVTVILANSERILGGAEIVFDELGVPQVVSKPGLVDRTVGWLSSELLARLLAVLLPVAAAGFAIWIGIRLWFSWKSQRRRFERMSH